MYKFLFKLTFCLIIIFSFNSFVYADTQLYSFSISNQSAISGQLVSLSWSGNETSGYILNFSCVDGVKIKKEDSSLVTCGSDFSTSAQNSDSMNFYIVNISGASKSVVFRIYPKSINGTSMPSLTQSQSITVSPATSPISSASVSTTTTTSKSPISVSWTSQDLDGVNFILDCVDGISFSTSADGVPLSCGNIAFSDKQNGSGTLNLYFKNTNSSNTAVNLKILPYIGNGAYDLTHSVSIPFNVSTDKSQPSQIINFSSLRSEITTGGVTHLSWSTSNTSGVNIKIDCADSLTFSLATSTYVPNKCDSLLTDTYFDANSSIDVVMYNSSNKPINTNLTLLTKLTTGGFDGINVRRISLQVDPVGWVSGSSVVNKVLPPTPSPINTYTQSPTQNYTYSSNKISSPRKKFYKLLTLGSKGDDVSALQEFLKNNNYYPEGLVTGYMGPATVRAVKKFQEQNKIAKFGQAGYGLVGPATRAKINSL